MMQQWYKLQYQINHFSFRERIGLFFSMSSALLALWALLFYSPEMKKVEQLKNEVTQEEGHASSFVERYQAILSLATSNNVNKLIAKLESLKTQRINLEKQIKRYNQRYLDENQLNELLYLVLNEAPGVSIEKFENLSKTKLELALSSGQTQDIKIRYLLSLKGNFFSIVNYLHHLEHLKWPLYWDKLIYKVHTYPEAIADIEFYILSPGKGVGEIK